MRVIKSGMCAWSYFGGSDVLLDILLCFWLGKIADGFVPVRDQSRLTVHVCSSSVPVVMIGT